MSRRRGPGAWWVLALTLPIAGCGFQLKGTQTLPPAMEVTYIQPQNRFSLVARGLEQALEASGARVTDQAHEATARVVLLQDDSGQRLLSVSPQNQPLEYEVYYSVRFEVIGRKGTLLEPQFLNFTRDYTYDTTQVIGKARESEYIRQALAEEIVDTILRRLASL